MLTDRQIADTRRYIGYPTLNPGEPDYVYTGDMVSSVSLGSKLANLTSDEEAILVDQYLTPLATLETDIYGTRDNIDTTEAGPWKSNPQELGERTRLYSQYRRAMCGFLGFGPGPSLGAGGLQIVRS